MQPPPRKVKPSASLKNIQTDQVSKLNIKHQQECDLLEDMRTFFSRKAALEKEYAQGLLKVTSQLLKREFPAQPDLNCQDGQEHKTVCAVWRTILEESDKLAKARLQAAEVYSERVAEPLKPAKAAKVQCFKKVMPQLSVIHAEVAQCVVDLVKTQKAYLTEGSVANEARQKSSEAEDKLKRKSTGIFQSLASLQKTCGKLKARTEASETKETATRNEYLLSLAAANAHQIRYYSTDLPDIMKTLDCDVYEKIQESLTLSGQVASEIADTEASFFHSIAAEAAKICREFSQQCYLFQNPVFTNLVQYQFEPCLGETCNKLTSDHNALPDLEKEARKWSTRVAKETRAIRDYYRQMTTVQAIRTGDKVSDSGSQDSAVTDPEAKLEELKQNIRKAEVTKLKAEARLEALRLGGVNVDEWMNQAQMESLVAEESGLTRTPSQVSLRTESSGGQSANDDHEPTYTHYDDDDDFIDDTFSPSSNRSGRVYPIVCSALYDFQASNYDEMTIKAGDGLELVADGDGEGWVKAKNLLGQEGYIPETYVDLSGLSNKTTPLGVEAINTINDSISGQPALSSQQRQQPPPVVQPAPDLQSPTSGDLQQDTASSYSSGDLEVQQTTEVMATGGQLVPSTFVTCTELSWARALYDYEAQTEEELSFLEGALIRVLGKDDGGVDDGFWQGECNGCLGMFPSLVVEELAGPPDDPLSPGIMAAQPDFSIPPPVHVTLPTPENEPPPPPSIENGEGPGTDDPLPSPPPTAMELYDSQEDSQSTPTPTAEQSPKRVRFEHLVQDQHYQHRRQHSQPHHPTHPQQKQVQVKLQRSAGSQIADSDRRLSARQRTDQPTLSARQRTDHSALSAGQQTDHPTLSARQRTDHPTLSARQRTDHSAISAGQQTDHSAISARQQTDHPTLSARQRTDHSAISAGQQTDHSAISARQQTDHPTLSARQRTDHSAISARQRTDHPTLSARQRTDHSALSARQRTDHPTKTDSPMLRHKSLPSSLDQPGLDQGQQDSHPPQPALCPCLFSLSQPQLSLQTSPPLKSPQSTPPPSRRLVLHRLKHRRQLQHFPSELPMRASDVASPAASLTTSDPSTQPHNKGSPSNTPPPLVSPQADALTTSSMQVSFHQTGGTHDSQLLSYQLYQQAYPDVCHRNHHSATSDLNPHPSLLVQPSSDNSKRVMSTQHHHEQPHLTNTQHHHEQPHLTNTQHHHEQPHLTNTQHHHEQLHLTNTQHHHEQLHLTNTQHHHEQLHLTNTQHHHEQLHLTHPHNQYSPGNSQRLIFTYHPQDYPYNPNSPHHPQDYPNSPHHQQDYPNSPHHQQDYPNSPHHQQDYPNSPHHHQDYPNSPHHQQDYPNSPHNQQDYPNSPHHQQEYPNSPHHQQDYPNSPHHQQDYPNSPHHQQDYPNSPHNQQDYPNSAHHQQDYPHLHKQPHSNSPNSPHDSYPFQAEPPPYMSATLPHKLVKPPHGPLSLGHDYSSTWARPSNKLPNLCRTQDDGWESEEGEESLV